MDFTVLFKNDNEQRICRYCGCNIDVPAEMVDLLYELHARCWQRYRREGFIYPIPANY